VTAPAQPWHEHFRVRAYEADARGLASIQTICNYLQEAAGNHAYHLNLAVDQLLQRNLTWVLARLHVRMNAYPRWRDELAVTTWPSGANRLYAFRDYTLDDAAGRPLGTAASAWILLDVKNRRPVRVPAEVAALAVRDKPRAIDDAFAQRLDEPARADAERTFVIRVSDLDVNQHVNLVNYIEWSVETVPAEVREQAMLSDLQVEFHAESVFGDEAVSRHCGGREGDTWTYRHGVYRRADHRVLAVAATTWTARTG